MESERQSKYCVPKIDQNDLELDDEVRELFLFVAIKLKTDKGTDIFLLK